MHFVEGHGETPLEEAARHLGIDAKTVPENPPSALAKYVLDRFNVNLLGETEAVLTLCDIVNHVPFENSEERTRLVSRAEARLGELMGIDEVHMADAERIEYLLLVEGMTLEDVRATFKSSRKE